MRGTPAVLAATMVLLAPGAAARADLADVQKRGAVRVLAVDEDLFLSLKPNTPPGFDREVLEAFAQLHKLKVEIVALPGWDAMIDALIAGKGDLIAGGYADTPARRKLIEFSAEVFPSRKVSFNRKPAAPLRTLEELRGGKVGTVKGTSMAEALLSAGVPEAHLLYFASGTLPEALRTGKAPAVVLPVEHAILEQRKDPAIQLGPFVGNPVSLAFGLRKGDTALKAALDQFIENFRRTPSWSRLVVKYLGEDAPDILKRARAQ